MSMLVVSFMSGILARIVTDRLGGWRPGPHTLSRVRHRLHHIVVTYLLLHIGFAGGMEIARGVFGALVIPGLLSVGLALTMFALSWVVFPMVGLRDRESRVAVAVHFGSVSVGTFAAAQSVLVSRGVPFDAAAAAWLALMEVPAIIAGAIVLGGGVRSAVGVLQDKHILTIIGAFLLGYTSVFWLPSGVWRVFDAPFVVFLAYFLLEMGYRAGEYLSQLRRGGVRLVLFGIVMPLFGGVLGSVVGTLVGITLGNLVLLSTLAASASYVAAPAAMSRLVPPRAVATGLTLSLGVVLPWNITVGIPLYLRLASALEGGLPRLGGGGEVPVVLMMLLSAMFLGAVAVMRRWSALRGSRYALWFHGGV